jgi:hypothetical protein
MKGQDTFSDDDLFPVFLTGIGAFDESGLSADFDVAVAQFSMDEDDDLFDDVDEVHADIDVRSRRPGLRLPLGRLPAGVLTGSDDPVRGIGTAGRWTGGGRARGRRRW